MWNKLAFDFQKVSALWSWLCLKTCLGHLLPAIYWIRYTNQQVLSTNCGEQVFLFGTICICIVFVFVVAIVQWSQRQWDQLRCYHKPTLITSLHRNLNLSICNRPGQPSFHSTKTFWTCIISSRYNKQNVKPQKILPWSKYRRRDQISSTGFVVRIFILS